jgi:hypothetical protein
MIVAVTGGRHYANLPHVSDVLNELHARSKITLIVNGGCTGADHLSTLWARSRGISYCLWPANFDYYGKGGGPRRNQAMLSVMKPEILVVFPGNDGTANCKRIAGDLDIPILEPLEPTKK